ncbi:MAG: PTS sugar transporter subunit IIA [Lactobacillus panisapium]|uniref:PTS fructose transporter subunit IIA n=1 Tax=Lactobacillus panisapium TaxID=2012495 RepID=A0ABX8W8W1_9LACO|nr:MULTISPECIES: PTS fructose transporter subunit IIA [Lactobacillus]MCO6532458.1 PTS fructose transporter subunit IIA [Lactobacillus sp.]MCO6533967.1 PTS fructose transporter subunit IIA [Lactobacillus sp.]MCO6535793.1 PTS fructose transporter subunit IIA [Lactobacillus sp.]MCT6892038.1 PTS fructose transporter subunit IIA [Lactobacillus sp.]QYN52217.1 PTS fructose transporter subunit IIA [Lactobacillus panisapium]
MTEILIASHGHFASGLKSSIDILTGMGNQVKTIDAYVDQTDYTDQINDFIKTAKRPAVIFTDLKGGSVNQKVVLKAASEKDIYVITQTNLAIVMAVLLDSEKLTENHLEELIQQSQVELFKVDKENKDLEEQKSAFFD